MWMFTWHFLELEKLYCPHPSQEKHMVRRAGIAVVLCKNTFTAFEKPAAVFFFSHTVFVHIASFILCLSEWHYENPLNVLVIIGPKVSTQSLVSHKVSQDFFFLHTCHVSLSLPWLSVLLKLPRNTVPRNSGSL